MPIRVARPRAADVVPTRDVIRRPRSRDNVRPTSAPRRQLVTGMVGDVEIPQDRMTTAAAGQGGITRIAGRERVYPERAHVSGNSRNSGVCSRIHVRSRSASAMVVSG